MVLSPHLKRDKYGLVPNQVKVLRFLYDYLDGVESKRIGQVVYPHAEWPGSRVWPALNALCGKKLVARIGYGYYKLTEDGEKLVEEMGDE